jgi:hypothetical protein
VTYEIVDLDGGDVLETFASSDAAEAAAAGLLDEDPGLQDDIVIVAIDEQGRRVDEFLPASPGIPA